MIIDTPNVNMIVLVITFMLGAMFGVTVGLFWRGYPSDTYAEEELDADPDLIGDGFGNWAKKYCEDCGAPMQFVRPGETRCSSQCYIYTPHKNKIGGTEER